METEGATETQVYFGDWEGTDWKDRSGKAALEAAFDEELGEDIHIVFAYYNYEDYSGRAYVLFEREGQLLEVAGSHCSCYGLEGQWQPTEVTPNEVRSTLARSAGYYLDDDADAYKAAVLALMRFEESQRKGRA